MPIEDFEPVECSRTEGVSSSRRNSLSESQAEHSAIPSEPLLADELSPAMTDLKIMSEEDVRTLLADVVSTHQDAAKNAQSPERHQAVVEIVQRILAGKNGVRH